MQTILCPFCLKMVRDEICPFCGNPVNYSGHHSHLPVGYTLQGRSTYILGAAKGQGGFGITYIALDMASGSRVAIKEYYPSHCCGRTNASFVESGYGQEETFSKGKQHFLLEAQMLQSLSDLDSVVKVLDYFEANNSAYLVMEYLDGSSLKDHVENNGKMPAQVFLNQLKPLMADMEKMHQRGVVHRDIAPDNIILLPDGRLKLIDFGAARSYVGDKSMTVVVKKGFAPVEQYMRKGSNASTDVYALAATIYYCITGIIPPDSAERQYGEAELLAPTALGVDLSQAQERGLEKALAIQPKERIQSVAELAKALAQIPRPEAPKQEKPKSEKVRTALIKEKTQKLQTVQTQKADSSKNVKWLIPAAAAVAVLCIVVGFLFTGKEDTSLPDAPVQMENEQTDMQSVTQLSPEAQKYNEAVDFFKNEEYGKAAIAFAKLGDYRDAKEISRQIWDAIAVRESIGSGWHHTVGLKSDGTAVSVGKFPDGRTDVETWADVVAVSAQAQNSAALYKDGTVAIIGSGAENLQDWKDIVQFEFGNSCIVGLKADGTIVAKGDEYSKDLVEEYAKWTDIVAFSYPVGLKSDGTVIHLDSDYYDLSSWSGIISLSSNFLHVIGLKENGTVLVAGTHVNSGKCNCDVSEWTNIISVSAGPGHVLGLKSDGTVVAAGSNSNKQCNVEDWRDIVAVKSGESYSSFGIKSDGTVVVAGTVKMGNVISSEWTDIRLPADRDALLSQIHLEYITDEDTISLPEPETTPLPVELNHLGGSYYGAVLDGQPHGNGTLTWEEGSYEGSFSQGYPSGSGTFTFSDGTSIQGDAWDYGTAESHLIPGTYQGLLLDSKPAGYGILSMPYGGMYQGTFKEDHPYGNGMYTYLDCSSISGFWNWTTDDMGIWLFDRQGAEMFYTGMTCDGVLSAYGSLRFTAGGSFQGEFSRNNPAGWGVYTYRNPRSENDKQLEGTNWSTVFDEYRYENHYYGLKLDGKWQGFGIGIMESGYAYCGEIRNDFRDGYGELYTAKDTLERRAIYRNGELSETLSKS